MKVFQYFKQDRKNILKSFILVQYLGVFRYVVLLSSALLYVEYETKKEHKIKLRII